MNVFLILSLILTNYFEISDLYQFDDLHVLEHTINQANLEANKHLLTLLVSTYKYKETLFALKQYMLLGSGDFVTTLLSELEYCSF